MRILLIGGSKSGKSTTAQRLCRRLAAEFDVVCDMAAGVPRVWKGAWPL